MEKKLQQICHFFNEEYFNKETDDALPKWNKYIKENEYFN